MTAIELRAGYTTGDPRLDRIPQEDRRSLRYPIAQAFLPGETAVPLRSYTWAVGAQRLSEPQLYLDQGQEGACVGFAFAHEAAAKPEVVPGINPDWARRLYWEAQKTDPWDGGAWPGALPFYEGTSTLAGAQTLQKAGVIKAYLWARSELEVAYAVAYKGPVVLGIDWYEGMYQPGPDGFLECSGPVVGGHAILAMGFSLKRDAYLLHNSWGPGWGGDGQDPAMMGRAWLRRTDLALLLRTGGDACLPIRKHQPLRSARTSPILH